MQNPLRLLRGFVVELFQDKQKPSPTRNLSFEEFRQMLLQSLVDPEIAQALRKPLAGAVFPFVGGMGCPTVTGPTPSSTANKLSKWSDANCTLADSGVFEDSSGRVGIGTTSPGTDRVVSRFNPDGSGQFQFRAESDDGPFLGLLADANADSYNNIVQSRDNCIIYSNGGGNDTTGFVIAPWRTDLSGLRMDSYGKLGIGIVDRLSMLTAKGKSSFSATGTVSITNGSATVSGSSTKFTHEVGVGDRITISSQTRTVVSIASDTSLTVDASFTTTASSQTMTTVASLLRCEDSSGNVKLVVSDEGNVGIGTASPGKKLTVYEGQTLQEVGLATLNDLESIATRIGSRLYQVGLSGQTQSAALYMEIDPVESSQGKDIFGIIGEVTANQVDGKGGFMKVTHKGAGDAIFVPLFTSGGAAIEAASNADGTKGIISTMQAANRPNSTLFNALWKQTTLPGYGMYFADQSPGNGLVIRKLDPQVGSIQDSDTQIRVVDYDASQPPSSSRDRFAVQNDGTTRVSSAKATSGTQTQDSPPMSLRGAYWNGSASVDLDWKLRNDVTGSNASRLAIQEPGGNDRVAVLDSGDIVVLTAGKGIILKNSAGTACARVRLNDAGNGLVFDAISCP